MDPIGLILGADRELVKSFHFKKVLNSSSDIKNNITKYGTGYNKENCPFLTTLQHVIIKPVPDDKSIALSKLKTFADNKVNISENIKFVSHRLDNITRRGEMLVTGIFSFSHNIFKQEDHDGPISLT